MAKFGEGDAVKDLLWFIGIFALFGIAWFVMGGPARYEASHGGEFVPPPSIAPTTTEGGERPLPSSTAPAAGSGTPSSRPAPFRPVRNEPAEDSAAGPAGTADANESPYRGQVTIRLGQSGEYASGINQEYAVVAASYSNKKPVVITGWKIDNGKGQKTYISANGGTFKGVSTVVAIPAGAQYLSGTSASSLGPIALGPGEQAYVVTGRLPMQTPYRVDASFRVNKCSGYLARLPGYQFTPYLFNSCPSYRDEIGEAAVPDDCSSYVYSYGSSCRTPELARDREGNTLVDGRDMPGACRQLIVSSFNYPACLARHKDDKDFYGKSWYVYLNRSGFPLYAKDRATVTLYDAQGKAVDEYSY